MKLLMNYINENLALLINEYIDEKEISVHKTENNALFEYIISLNPRATIMKYTETENEAITDGLYRGIVQRQSIYFSGVSIKSSESMTAITWDQFEIHCEDLGPEADQIFKNRMQIEEDNNNLGNIDLVATYKNGVAGHYNNTIQSKSILIPHGLHAQPQNNNHGYRYSRSQKTKRFNYTLDVTTVYGRENIEYYWTIFKH